YVYTSRHVTIGNTCLSRAYQSVVTSERGELLQPIVVGQDVELVVVRAGDHDVVPGFERGRRHVGSACRVVPAGSTGSQLERRHRPLAAAVRRLRRQAGRRRAGFVNERDGRIAATSARRGAFFEFAAARAALGRRGPGPSNP